MRTARARFFRVALLLVGAGIFVVIGALVLAWSPNARFAVQGQEPASQGLQSRPQPRPGSGSKAALAIPSGHPRLWFDADRLERARSWYRKNGYNPGPRDFEGLAFRYLMNGDKGSCRTAIQTALSLQVNTGGVASNEARWHGETAILIYDWCHPVLTAQEKENYLRRWNGYLGTLMRKTWGGAGMSQNNYFWGYLRNELLWGVATHGENPMADEFVTNALENRWEKDFVSHAAKDGRGGVAQEGVHYGAYLLRYSIVPMQTATLLGRNLYAESNYFREAVFALIYGTTPRSTQRASARDEGFELFTWNDDHQSRWGRSATNRDYGDFMTVMANQEAGTPLAGYARTWLKLTEAPRSGFVEAVDKSGEALPFAGLPLDYYAPGPRFLFSRSSWDQGATALHFQLGPPTQVGHAHFDVGGWQMWRNGRWLSRETTAYGENLVGYANSGGASGRSAELHNVLLVNGKGLADGSQNGPGSMRRLESRPEYLYAAVDLTDLYRNTVVARHRPERDNPAVAHVEREFLFVRPLETLVILDRIESNAVDGKPAASVVKTFLAHFEKEPKTQSANSVLATNGKEALRLLTLLPATPQYRVVNEGGEIGQFRLEVDTSGSAETHMLHVLQARESSGPDVTAKVADKGASYELTLVHPQRGTVVITFVKGMQSSGGSIAIGGRVQKLTEGVQEITVTEKGPAWGPLP